MKKNKDLMLKLLNEKSNFSFKEISMKTGYHEKSLIRIKKMQENNQYKFRNITLKEKENIINLYLNSNIKNIRKFYDYYINNSNNFPVRSYSTIQKTLKKLKKEKENNYIIVGNIFNQNSFERTFYAYDYDNKNIIYLEKGFKETYKVYFKIIKYIQLYFKNKIIVFKGNSFLKNKKGVKYESFINYLNKNKICYSFDTIYLSKKIINKIININQNIGNLDDNVIKSLILEKIIILEEERKILNNNVIEYKNIKYKINTKNILPNGKIVNIIQYLFDSSYYVKVDNKIYNLITINKKESKNKYS